jgi:hypothetical protein
VDAKRGSTAKVENLGMAHRNSVPERGNLTGTEQVAGLLRCATKIYGRGIEVKCLSCSDRRIVALEPPTSGHSASLKLTASGSSYIPNKSEGLSFPG